MKPKPKDPAKATSSLPAQSAEVGHLIERIRTGRRTRRDTAHALGEFLPKQYARDVDRPYRRLGALADLWQTQIPERIASKTALASFNRGVLTVHVVDSTTRYDLDRLLRGGIEAELRRSFRGGTLNRVKVVVKPEIGHSQS